MESLFDFSPDPTEKNMLPLKTGDRVIVIDKAGDGQGWWKAYDDAANRVGFIPKDFVRNADSGNGDNNNGGEDEEDEDEEEEKGSKSAAPETETTGLEEEDENPSITPTPGKDLLKCSWKFSLIMSQFLYLLGLSLSDQVD